MGYLGVRPDARHLEPPYVRPRRNFAPIWTPDGKRLTFQTFANSGKRSISWAPADGSGSAEELLQEDTQATPGSWLPDGSALAFYQGSQEKPASGFCRRRALAAWRRVKPGPSWATPACPKSPPTAAGLPTSQPNRPHDRCTCSHSRGRAANTRFQPRAATRRAGPETGGNFSIAMATR